MRTTFPNYLVCPLFNASTDTRILQIMELLITQFSYSFNHILDLHILLASPI